MVIRAYDPYAENSIWTAKDSNGNEYKGAEVTSKDLIYMAWIRINIIRPDMQLPI